MQEYLIDVGEVESYQVITDKESLLRIFARAKSTIVNGEKVILLRKERNGVANRFDELTTLEDLENYQKQVMKFL